MDIFKSAFIAVGFVFLLYSGIGFLHRKRRSVILLLLGMISLAITQFI